MVVVLLYTIDSEKTKTRYKRVENAHYKSRKVQAAIAKAIHARLNQENKESLQH